MSRSTALGDKKRRQEGISNIKRTRLEGQRESERAGSMSWMCSVVDLEQPNRNTKRRPIPEKPQLGVSSHFTPFWAGPRRHRLYARAPSLFLLFPRWTQVPCSPSSGAWAGRCKQCARWGGAITGCRASDEQPSARPHLGRESAMKRFFL